MFDDLRIAVEHAESRITVREILFARADGFFNVSVFLLFIIAAVVARVGDHLIHLRNVRLGFNTVRRLFRFIRNRIRRLFRFIRYRLDRFLGSNRLNLFFGNGRLTQLHLIIAVFITGHYANGNALLDELADIIVHPECGKSAHWDALILGDRAACQCKFKLLCHCLRIIAQRFIEIADLDQHKRIGIAVLCFEILLRHRIIIAVSVLDGLCLLLPLLFQLNGNGHRQLRILGTEYVHCSTKRFLKLLRADGRRKNRVGHFHSEAAQQHIDNGL